jgi:recombinational DNA repair protein RecR
MVQMEVAKQHKWRCSLNDNTAEIIKGALQKIIDPAKTKITILGRGLSTGAELEYADSETIKFALKNRN